MASRRYLIVNADDFGQSPGINEGVIKAYQCGIVTSASVMTRWPAAIVVGMYGREHPDLSLGLHFDLGEWFFRDESWVPLYEVARTDDASAVRRELWQQVEGFRRLVGRDPTHLDSHQHVHLEEPVRTFAREVANSLGIPLRGCGSEVQYCGDFYGQTADGSPLPGNITVARLIEILRTLPQGVTELGCHPGERDDLQTMYRTERAQEVRVLCDPRLGEVIAAEQIQLRSFASFVDVVQS